MLRFRDVSAWSLHTGDVCASPLDARPTDMTTTSPQAPAQPVFSKICHVPDLLCDGEPILSLYADAEQVLHMQCRLRASGHIVLFPVTFRLVNRYLSGDFTLADLVAQAPCSELMLVTRAHNFLAIDKRDFDVDQLSCAALRYPEIRDGKGASLREIREGLHACMRA